MVDWFQRRSSSVNLTNHWNNVPRLIYIGVTVTSNAKHIISNFYVKYINILATSSIHREIQYIQTGYIRPYTIHVQTQRTGNAWSIFREHSLDLLYKDQLNDLTVVLVIHFQTLFSRENHVALERIQTPTLPYSSFTTIRILKVLM